MYFLETIEGSKGERLTSAVLKYFFINSDGFRRLFFRHKQIGDKFIPSKRPTFKNGVICFHELATDGGDGFIDLVLVADNAVLGIENKLWAGLTDNQPAKYLPTLKRLADERCGGEAFKILMLVPRDRMVEIEKELRKQHILDASVILDWESILEDLVVLAKDETGEVASVALAFHEYLRRQLSDVEINADPTQLIGDVTIENVFQQDFLNKVWRTFDNAGRISAGGKGTDGGWYGFYFEFEGQEAKKWEKPWFGFVQRKSVVKLEVHTGRPTFPIQTSSFKQSGFSIQGNVILDVTFDNLEDSIQRWELKMQPLFDEFRKQLESSAAD